jgi:hypothetical protein
MKFLRAIPLLLLNVAGAFATTMELSREGLPAPHHRRSQVRILPSSVYERFNRSSDNTKRLTMCVFFLSVGNG